MKIDSKQIDNRLEIVLYDALDSSVYSELSEFIDKNVTSAIKELVFDFSKVVYISSFGMRCMLRAKRIMDNQGIMVIKNASTNVKDSFDCVGFSSFMDIE